MVDGLVFRGRGETMKLEAGSLSISLPTSIPIIQRASASSTTSASSPAPSSSRLTCVAAAILAFVFGVIVGVTLPLIFASEISITAPLTYALPQQEHILRSPRHQNTVVVQDESGVGDNDNSDTWQNLQVTGKPLAPIHIWNSQDGVNDTIPPTTSPLSTSVAMPPERDAPDVIEGEEEPSLLVKGVFWGEVVENALPKGFLDKEVDSWRKFTKHQAVVRLEEGCGRMQNRLITFENGTLSCCRYRQNYDQIQGEIFSFYLSRLLGITNVPPSALGVIKAGTWQWSNVGNQLALAQWAEDRPVVMTRFVENLTSAFIPSSLRSARRRLHPYQVEEFDPKDIKTLTELAQWSDLIIFDYLTGNLDRVVNNLYNMQWNPTMMEAPAHNLAHHEESGLLVFLDNESGLLHGYRLLDKYESFHASLLKALCVFRQSTAERVRRLVATGDVGDRLRKMFRRYEPDLQDFLPLIPDKSIKILNERLQSVHKQISKCEKMYTNS